MKKSSIIVGSMMVTALGGYGAWCCYKKLNPQCAKKFEKDIKKVTKNMEKSIEDMM